MALRFPRDRINTGNTNKYQVPLPVDALSRTLDRAVPQKPSTTFPYSYAPVQSAFSSQPKSISGHAKGGRAQGDGMLLTRTLDFAPRDAPLVRALPSEPHSLHTSPSSSRRRTPVSRQQSRLEITARRTPGFSDNLARFDERRQSLEQTKHTAMQDEDTYVSSAAIRNELRSSDERDDAGRQPSTAPDGRRRTSRGQTPLIPVPTAKAAYLRPQTNPQLHSSRTAASGVVCETEGQPAMAMATSLATVPTEAEGSTLLTTAPWRGGYSLHNSMPAWRRTTDGITQLKAAFKDRSSLKYDNPRKLFGKYSDRRTGQLNANGITGMFEEMGLAVGADETGKLLNGQTSMEYSDFAKTLGHQVDADALLVARSKMSASQKFSNVHSIPFEGACWYNDNIELSYNHRKGETTRLDQIQRKNRSVLGSLLNDEYVAVTRSRSADPENDRYYAVKHQGVRYNIIDGTMRNPAELRTSYDLPIKMGSCASRWIFREPIPQELERSQLDCIH